MLHDDFRCASAGSALEARICDNDLHVTKSDATRAAKVNRKLGITHKLERETAVASYNE